MKMTAINKILTIRYEDTSDHGTDNNGDGYTLEKELRNICAGHIITGLQFLSSIQTHSYNE